MACFCIRSRYHPKGKNFALKWCYVQHKKKGVIGVGQITLQRYWFLFCLQRWQLTSNFQDDNETKFTLNGKFQRIIVVCIGGSKSENDFDISVYSFWTSNHLDRFHWICSNHHQHHHHHHHHHHPCHHHHHPCHHHHEVTCRWWIRAVCQPALARVSCCSTDPTPALCNLDVWLLFHCFPFNFYCCFNPRNLWSVRPLTKTLTFDNTFTNS